MLKMILIIAVLVPISVMMPIWLNAVPVFAEPGAGQRLKTYMTTNLMVTSQDHPFPEMRPQQFDVSVEEMFQILVDSADLLGWEIVEKDEKARSVAFVVTTSMWQFKDDVTVQVAALGQGSVLAIRSQSRVGRGDFGANLGHVMRLLAAIREKVAVETG